MRNHEIVNQSGQNNFEHGYSGLGCLSSNQKSRPLCVGTLIHSENTECRSDIQHADLKGVVLNKLSARFDLISH